MPSSKNFSRARMVTQSKTCDHTRGFWQRRKVRTNTSNGFKSRANRISSKGQPSLNHQLHQPKLNANVPPCTSTYDGNTSTNATIASIHAADVPNPTTTSSILPSHTTFGATNYQWTSPTTNLPRCSQIRNANPANDPY